MEARLAAACASLVNRCRSASYQTEERAEVSDQLAPHIRLEAQTLENRGLVGRCDATLAGYRLPSGPVEQRQIIFDRHIEKAIVAATIAAGAGTGSELVAQFVDGQRRQEAIWALVVGPVGRLQRLDTSLR